MLGHYGYKTGVLQEYLLHVLEYVQHVEHFVGVDVTQYVAVYAAQVPQMTDKWVWMSSDGHGTAV